MKERITTLREETESDAEARQTLEQIARLQMCLWLLERSDDPFKL
jgi:hypothetical protein